MARALPHRRPSLSYKFLPYSWGFYVPRPTELVITAATLRQ
ncbi:MAG: hypothetical protein U0Q11_16840 [Vicinamibacterales bacterium]